MLSFCRPLSVGTALSSSLCRCLSVVASPSSFLCVIGLLSLSLCRYLSAAPFLSLTLCRCLSVVPSLSSPLYCRLSVITSLSLSLCRLLKRKHSPANFSKYSLMKSLSHEFSFFFKFNPGFPNEDKWRKCNTKLTEISIRVKLAKRATKRSWVTILSHSCQGGQVQTSQGEAKRECETWKGEMETTFEDPPSEITRWIMQHDSFSLSIFLALARLSE